MLLGSTGNPDLLRGAFRPAGVCRALPSPALQAPDLLLARADVASTAPLSCADLAAQDAQSLSINAAVAALAVDVLVRLLLAGGLGRFATYLDLETGAMRSYYTSPAEVGRVLDRPPRWFTTR